MTLEELLNKLIERGWKPFGIKSDEFYIYISKFFQIVITYYRLDLYGDKERDDKRYSYREITSKESGLWQFCVENGMIRKDRFTWMISPDPLGEDQYNYTDYRYRLIESSLKDESELEGFLLNNIKIDE